MPHEIGQILNGQILNNGYGGIQYLIEDAKNARVRNYVSRILTRNSTDLCVLIVMNNVGTFN